MQIPNRAGLLPTHRFVEELKVKLDNLQDRVEFPQARYGYWA